MPDGGVHQALEENFWELWSRFGRGEGCALHERDGALWYDTPIPTLPYNAVLRFSAADPADSRIDALFEHYRRRGVPFMWLLHPSARPTDLGDRLRVRGLKEVERVPGMAMNLAELPELEALPEGIEVREAIGEADFRIALELVAWRWEVPAEVKSKLRAVTSAFDIGQPGGKVRCWIGWRGGTAVSKVVLNLGSRAAGLYGVATKPEARGLGLARILTLQAFHAARREGYQLGVLHSSPMARNLYAKIGFRPAAAFSIYAPPRALRI